MKGIIEIKYVATTISGVEFGKKKKLIFEQYLIIRVFFREFFPFKKIPRPRLFL